MSPATVAHEVELLGAVPGVRLSIATDGGDWEADDVHVLPRVGVPVLGRPSGGTASVSWLRGLRRVAHDVDAVVSLELFAARSVQAGALARRLGVPHVVVLFENLADNPLYRLPPWSRFARRTIAHADLFVCLTETAREHAVALGCPPDRCVVVHPGVDTRLFRPADGGRAAEPRVVFVGQLRADRGADKGLETVVAACDALLPEVPGLELTVIGDGPLRPWLEARAASSPFIRVLGPRTPAEVALELRRSRVFALASRRTAKWAEQFGFVLAEAMASGLPIVATRSGAIPEVVGPGNPLVAEGDVAAFARGVRDALGDAGDEWGRRNRQRALDEFDLRTQAVRLGAALEMVGRVPRPVERGRWVRDHLPPVERLLDVGCSDGTFTVDWADRGTLTIGVDPEPERLQLVPPPILRVRAAGGALPFADAAFDALTMVETLEHVPAGTERAVLTELRRVLRPDGLLLLTTPHRGLFWRIDPLAVLGRYAGVTGGERGHRHYRTSEIDALLEGLFTVEERHRSSLLLFPLAFWFPAGRGRRRLALRRWMTDWDYRHRFGPAAYNIAIVARPT
jgi:glycosyltransferase involved in cell wall biosynthesis